MTVPKKIKVCGMRKPENLEKVCALGPDYVGYIFYPGSKRYVGKRPDPVLFELPPAEITKVGVFVNEQMNRVKEMFEVHGLGMVQLHGNEPPAYCRLLLDSGIPVIKALRPDEDWEEYKDVVQLFLFDSPGTGWGGTGQKFDWDLITKQSIPRHFLLSGGIGPEDANVLKDLKQENFWGIDINSRFELSPGLKDIRMLEKFIMEIRK